jgi:hypothetical protein
MQHQFLLINFVFCLIRIFLLLFLGYVQSSRFVSFFFHVCLWWQGNMDNFAGKKMLRGKKSITYIRISVWNPIHCSIILLYVCCKLYAHIYFFRENFSMLNGSFWNFLPHRERSRKEKTSKYFTYICMRICFMQILCSNYHIQ